MTGRLSGTRVLITREHKQANQLVDLVDRYGGLPVVVPLLTISCKHEKKQKKIMHHLSSYQWIFFTSTNGVHCFFQIMQEYGVTMADFSDFHLGAVGSKTASALENYGYQPDFVPTTYNACVMAKEFLPHYPNAGPILLVRGNMSRSVLPEELATNKIPYDTIEVYETSFNYNMKRKLNKLIREKAFDMITFTSPSTVQAFMEMKTASNQMMKNIPVACIGTTTEQKVQSVGFFNTITPDIFTMEHMVAKMNNGIDQKG